MLNIMQEKLYKLENEIMTIKISENLQMLRKEKGLTQEELAEVLGVTNQSISKWELGLSCPDIMMLPRIAEYYSVTIDELLGYKSATSINNIYIKIHSYLTSIKDDGELIDAIYRICRLAGACTSKKDSNNTKNLIEGKYGNNSSMLQTYGKDYGGVLIHDINSIFISSFKNFEKIDINKIRKIYKMLSSLNNMNVLKVLVAFFENSNINYKGNFHKGISVNELSKLTSLSIDEVYEAMNQLDVKLDDESSDERWFIMHNDTVPILMLLIQSNDFFLQER